MRLDRAGLGASGAPSGPVTVADRVTDLHALLMSAGVRPPYVLAGHSIGGWYLRLFTARYPDEVAGVVFIDSSHPDQDARAAAMLPPRRTDEDPALTVARSDTIAGRVPAAEGGWLDMAASEGCGAGER